MSEKTKKNKNGVFDFSSYSEAERASLQAGLRYLGLILLAVAIALLLVGLASNLIPGLLVPLPPRP